MIFFVYFDLNISNVQEVGIPTLLRRMSNLTFDFGLLKRIRHGIRTPLSNMLHIKAYVLGSLLYRVVVYSFNINIFKTIHNIQFHARI